LDAFFILMLPSQTDDFGGGMVVAKISSPPYAKGGVISA
jgi:hypothetical protein